MLNQRARDIHAFIQRFRRDRGSAPTIREIGQAFKITSTNGVRYYTDMLEKAGMISIKRGVSRGIVPTRREAAIPAGIPILGRVAAGQPITAEENHVGTLELEGLFGETRELFALQVRGDSMIDAGILEGDYVVVLKRDSARPGEIVVALLDDEATVKTYQPKRGSVELVASNPRYAPIVVTPQNDFRILGVVRGVMRTLR